jgi:hypothetical protein
MHADAPVPTGIVRQSHLTSRSVGRSVKVLNPTAVWDRCRRRLAVASRDVLATQNLLTPTASPGRSFAPWSCPGCSSSRTRPRRAGWVATPATIDLIVTGKANQTPVGIVAPFINEFPGMPGALPQKFP